MILLGKYGNIELAMRQREEMVGGSWYDFRKLPAGMILTLTEKKPSTVGFPVPYSGRYENEFDQLPVMDFDEYDNKREALKNKKVREAYGKL